MKPILLVVLWVLERAEEFVSRLARWMYRYG